MVDKKILAVYKIFKRIPYNAVSFFSGIFVATSVNVFTCQIPKSVITIGLRFAIVGALFLIIAILLMWWSIIIEQAQDLYYKNIDIVKKDNEANESGSEISEEMCWYNCLVQLKSEKKLIGICIAILVLVLISGVLLV